MNSASKHERVSFRGKAVIGAGFLLALLFALLPSAAYAATSTGSASTLGALICNIKDNLSGYPWLLNATAYTIGLFLGVRSIFLFKKHGENPSQPQIVPAIAHFIGAGALLSLPSFAGALQRTLFGGGLAGAGNFSCVAVAGASPTGGPLGLDQMMQNFVHNIYSPIFKLLALICVCVGLTFIISGLLRGAKTGTNPQASDPKAIIAQLIFGSILISAGSVLPTVLQSLFGSGDVSSMTSINLISWSSIVGSGVDTEAADQTVRAILAFIQIIGCISFVRGWMILKKAVEGGQATIPQGLTHILGGAMAINIDVMLRILDKTFGTGIIN